MPSWHYASCVSGSTEIGELLREAEADPDVVGVVLGGSRGKDALVTNLSDHDVYVIVRDEAR